MSRRAFSPLSFFAPTASLPRELFHLLSFRSPLPRLLCFFDSLSSFFARLCLLCLLLSLSRCRFFDLHILERSANSWSRGHGYHSDAHAKHEAKIELNILKLTHRR